MTKSITSPLSVAIEKWTQAVSNVKVDQATLEAWGRSMLPDNRKPVVVISPATFKEVQDAVKIASEYEIPIYPISRGKNWGYGSACPVQVANVLMDLSRMNRIIEVNEELAYAVVEPGVTQQQLYEYLEEHNLPLCIDVTGAPPSASLLGNILERGYGQTPYSDHFLHSCGMDVILADGRLIRTGFGHFDKTKTQYLYKWGVGPYIDGLFTQSNLGIVTRIGVWLMPKPESVGMFHFKIANDEVLVDVMDRLRIMRLKGILVCAVHIFNDVRVISSLQQYPWKETGGKTPLPDEVLKKLIKKHNIAPWICAGGLRGTSKQVKLTLKEIKRHLKDIAQIKYVSERIFRIARKHGDLITKLTGVDLAKRRTLYELNRGIPTEQPSILPYWRSRKPAPKAGFEPLRDNCGLIWLAPVIPLQKEDIHNLMEIIRKNCETYGFEANISLNLITERALSCVLGILYDREQSEERQLAADCQEVLLKKFMEAGYVPYRMDTRLMEHIVKDDPFWQVCAEIKNVLDPLSIISPGRYSR